LSSTKDDSIIIHVVGLITILAFIIFIVTDIKLYCCIMNI